MPRISINFPKFKKTSFLRGDSTPHPAHPIIRELIKLNVNNSEDLIRFHLLVNDFIPEMHQQLKIFNAAEDAAEAAADDLVPFVEMMFQDYARKSPFAWFFAKYKMNKIVETVGQNENGPIRDVREGIAPVGGMEEYSFRSLMSTLDGAMSKPLPQQDNKFINFFRSQMEKVGFKNLSKQRESYTSACSNFIQGIRQGMIEHNQLDNVNFKYSRHNQLKFEEAMMQYARSNPSILEMPVNEQVMLGKALAAEFDGANSSFYVDEIKQHISTHPKVTAFLESYQPNLNTQAVQGAKVEAADPLDTKIDTLRSLILDPKHNEQEIRTLMQELISAGKSNALNELVEHSSNFVKKRGLTNLLKSREHVGVKRQSIVQDILYQEFEKAAVAEIQPLMGFIFRECKNYNGVSSDEVKQAKDTAYRLYKEHQSRMPESMHEQFRQVNDYIHQAVFPKNSQEENDTMGLNAQVIIEFKTFKNIHNKPEQETENAYQASSKRRI